MINNHYRNDKKEKVCLKGGYSREGGGLLFGNAILAQCFFKAPKHTASTSTLLAPRLLFPPTFPDVDSIPLKSVNPLATTFPYIDTPKLATNMDGILNEFLQFEVPQTFADQARQFSSAVVPQQCPSPVGMDYFDLDFDLEQLLRNPNTIKHENNESSCCDTEEKMQQQMLNAAEEEEEEAQMEDAHVDAKIYTLFPMDALRKPRNEFGQWKKTYKNPAVRSLTPRENKRLSALRRVILARVYAEKARLKKGQETESMKGRLGRLTKENDTLRRRVQKLEGVLADLQNQFSRSRRNSGVAGTR